MLQNGRTLRMLCWVRPDCHKRTNAVQLHVCEALRAIRFIEAESRIVTAKGGGVKTGELSAQRVCSFRFARWKKLWRGMMGMAAWQCQGVNAAELYTWKWLRGYIWCVYLTAIKNKWINTENHLISRASLYRVPPLTHLFNPSYRWSGWACGPAPRVTSWLLRSASCSLDPQLPRCSWFVQSSWLRLSSRLTLWACSVWVCSRSSAWTVACPSGELGTVTAPVLTVRKGGQGKSGSLSTLPRRLSRSTGLGPALLPPHLPPASVVSPQTTPAWVLPQTAGFLVSPRPCEHHNDEAHHCPLLTSVDTK